MSEVKRYMPSTNYAMIDLGTHGRTRSMPDAWFVRAEDYDALEAENRRLLARVNAIESRSGRTTDALQEAQALIIARCEREPDGWRRRVVNQINDVLAERESEEVTHE
jgi:hypothetical protein